MTALQLLSISVLCLLITATHQWFKIRALERKIRQLEGLE